MNEDIIYLVKEFIKKHDETVLAPDRPEQKPFSRWAMNEIIYELESDYSSYPDEIIRKYIRLMGIYENAAEIERKNLFRIASDTAKDLYSYLFDRPCYKNG